MATFKQPGKPKAFLSPVSSAKPAAIATVQSSPVAAVRVGMATLQSATLATVQPTAVNLTILPGIGATLPGSRNTRPLWFNGRFLAAPDLRREQNYFLQKQAIYGRAGGSGVLHGLTVQQAAPGSQFDTAETIIIGAGVGITPSGQLVMISSELPIELSDLADEQNLDEQFGLAETPQQPSRTRTGVYIIALRPVQFTANPVASYPSSLQAPRVTQDGDIVEATAVSLVPFASPVNNFDIALQRAALARQIFVAAAGPTLPASMLPLAMIGIDRNVIQWIDPYLVRRDSGPQSSGIRLGLADAATQQAYLLQYDAQLQAVAASRAPAPLNFAATDYFQALPPAGRFPLQAIDVVNLLQQYFPQQLPVQLSLIPADELPAVIEDSMSLPPLDLTMPGSSFANYSVYALIPVDRGVFNSQQNSLTPTPLNPALPQLVPIFPPFRPFGPFRPLLTPPLTTPAPSGWQSVTSGMTYGFYVLRRSEPIYIDLTDSTAPATTTTPAPAATTPLSVVKPLALSQRVVKAPATTTTPAPGTSTSSTTAASATKAASIPLPVAKSFALSERVVQAPATTTTPPPPAPPGASKISASIETPEPKLTRIQKAPATRKAPARRSRRAPAGRKPRP
jgi:hypothetical protein